MDNNGFEMPRLPSADIEPIPQPLSEHKITRDELDLVHFGKRQQFKVGASIQILQLLFRIRLCADDELEKLQHNIYDWAYLYLDDNMGIVSYYCGRHSRADDFQEGDFMSVSRDYPPKLHMTIDCDSKEILRVGSTTAVQKVLCGGLFSHGWASCHRY